MHKRIIRGIAWLVLVTLCVSLFAIPVLASEGEGMTAQEETEVFSLADLEADPDEADTAPAEEEEPPLTNVISSDPSGDGAEAPADTPELIRISGAMGRPGKTPPWLPTAVPCTFGLRCTASWPQGRRRDPRRWSW